MDAYRKSEDPSLFEERPWGNFTILDESETFKVKRLVVYPGNGSVTSGMPGAPNTGSSSPASLK
jgi:mannose-6-phosphate isomerase-like protein (cupin superfamily)